MVPVTLDNFKIKQQEFERQAAAFRLAKIASRPQRRSGNSPGWIERWIRSNR